MSNKLTEVRLLSVPLENDYKDTLYFTSKEAQTTYFLSKTKEKGEDFTYQRKDKKIRFPLDFDEVVGCNYVMYKNASHTSKWYYAFITDIEYINDGLTDVFIDTDVMQTWMFDYTVKSSFVEREHCTDDTIGLHTVPEGLEMGEYIIATKTKDSKLAVGSKLLMGSTLTPGEVAKSIGGIYNGLYSGVKYYALDNENLSSSLKAIADKDESAISSLFLAPDFLYNSTGGVVAESDAPVSYEFNVNKVYGFEGYTPKNNKLRTSPYCYLLVSNGNGGVAKYNYEHFSAGLCTFKVYGVLTPGCSIRLIPQNYKGVIEPETEGLNLGKYPQCNWATDQYTNWLTQNGVNIATSLINAGVSAVGGAMVGGAVGGIGAVPGAIAGGLSGLTGIATTLNEVHKAEMVAPQVSGNTNCGDIVAQKGDNTFTYYNMTIRKEFAQIIDNYFSMFGYKTHRVKVPAKAHRKNYWYTKTIDVNINGGIPMKDLQKIKGVYNKGVTFWRNADNIGNYSVDNSIV